MGMHGGLGAGDTSDTPIYFLRYDKFGERLFNAAIGVQCSILGDTRSNFKKNILPSVTLYKDDFK